MEYRVHRLDVKRDSAQSQLQEFLDRMVGEVVSVVPMMAPSFTPMGATAKVAHLLVVEKLDWAATQPESDRSGDADSKTRLLPKRPIG